jgi:hypothetical protein
MPFSLWFAQDATSFVGSYTDTTGSTPQVKEWCGARAGALPSPCLAANFSGDWETNVGPLNIVQQAFDVSGTYTHETLDESGTVTGQLQEYMLDGSWSLGVAKGDFSIWLDPTGSTFRGNYEGPTGVEAWCGARSGFELPDDCLRQ